MITLNHKRQCFRKSVSYVRVVTVVVVYAKNERYTEIEVEDDIFFYVDYNTILSVVCNDSHDYVSTAAELNSNSMPITINTPCPPI